MSYIKGTDPAFDQWLEETTIKMEQITSSLKEKLSPYLPETTPIPPPARESLKGGAPVYHWYNLWNGKPEQVALYDCSPSEKDVNGLELCQ